MHDIRLTVYAIDDISTCVRAPKVAIRQDTLAAGAFVVGVVVGERHTFKQN